MKRKAQQGMSLFELLIVIALLGIIAASLMTSLASSKKAIDLNESNMRAIQAINTLGQKLENEKQTAPRSGLLYVCRDGKIEIDPQQQPADSRRYEYQTQAKVFEDGNVLILTTVTGEKNFQSHTTNGFKTDPPPTGGGDPGGGGDGGDTGDNGNGGGPKK